MRVPVMRALTGLLCLGLACMVCGQPTVPTFASISAPNGEPSNPSTPAAHGFYQPSQAAIDHLNRYTTVIELWFAGNSFDYLFGAFPGVRGIDDYNAGVAAGTYAPQKFASNAPSSLQVNSAYPALPYDFQGCQAAGAKQPCSPNVSLLYSAAVASNGGQPFPLAPIDMSSIISLANRVYTWGDPNEADGADSGAWRTDPEHGSLLNYLYALDGGANDGFIFWGSNGQDYTVPGYPQWSSRIGGTSLSYYNLSLPSNAALDGGTIPYLYQLAANYTLFDHFFASVMGASDVTFLGAAAGTLPPYDGVSSNCTAASNVFNTPNGTFTAQLCSYPAAGFASPAVIKGCSVLSDCTLVGELDGYLPSTWPQPAGPYNSSTCATVGFAPAIVDANHRLQPGNYGGDFLPPLSTRSMFSEMDDAGVKWAVYGKGLNSQIHGNFCDPEWPNYSAHNNPLHYYSAFSDPTTPYFQQHLRDDAQFFTDLSAGALPSFSWVTMNEVYDGAVGDSDVGMLDVALQAHMDAIFASAGWKAGTTLVNVVFSESGMLWDHVAPYAGDKVGPGVRVPLIAIAPDFAGGGVNHYPYEHFSLRKMIQRRFAINNTILSPTRYYAARDFTNAFDDAHACYLNPCSGTTSTAAQCSSANRNAYSPVAGAAVCSALSPSSTASPGLNGAERASAASWAIPLLALILSVALM